MWWCFGVVLIFGSQSRWEHYFERLPALAFIPRERLVLLVMAICVVLFPVPMIAPFEAAKFRFVTWRKKRRLKKALVKILESVSKGKSGEVAEELKAMIEKTKRL